MPELLLVSGRAMLQAEGPVLTVPVFTHTGPCIILVVGQIGHWEEDRHRAGGGTGPEADPAVGAGPGAEVGTEGRRDRKRETKDLQTAIIRWFIAIMKRNGINIDVSIFSRPRPQPS